MAHSVSADFRSSFLHVKVEGDNTFADVSGYLESVARLCDQHGCAYVLIEENLKGPSLGTISVFDIASRGAERARPLIRAMAYVDANPEHNRGDMQFAETVAVNRGLTVRVFPSVAEAEPWIRQQARD